MPEYNATDPWSTDAVPRRVMPLLFLVDTSGSMEGAKIASLNTAVREALNDVGVISHTNADAQIKVAVLEFSSGVDWMYPQPMESESFVWQDLEAGGLTSFGEALQELNKKLSKSNGYMSEPTGTRAPAIILLSDGEPTDEYKHALETIKGNPWFKVAVKVAIAIGDDANKGILAEFTGNIEAVITVHNVDQLKKIIHTVSVTASMVASQSASAVDTTDSGKPAGLADPTSQVVGKLTDDIKEEPGIDQGNSTANSGTDNWGDW